MHRKLWAGLGAAVVLLGMVGCSGSQEAADPTPTSSEQQGMQPDVSGIPDVVAEVNGEKITKDEFVKLYEGQFQQWQAQAQTTGEELDQETLRKQTADAMVDTELLEQEADTRHIDASEKDVDKALEELAAGNQMESTDDVLAALAEQGLEKDEVFAQLKTQVRLDRLIAEEAGDTTPTEKELRELYDQAKAQQKESGQEGAQMPPFEEVKPQLAEQAESSKQTEAYQALVAELREGADVKVNL